MPLFRCFFCTNEKGQPGRDFTAEQAVCPDCKASAAHPRMKDKVVKLETIHFHPPSKHHGIGVGYLACKPDTKFPDPSGALNYATGEPHVVNCSECKAAPLFAAAIAGLPEPLVVPEADFELQPASKPKE